MTNGDRVRAMSDEELANLASKLVDHGECDEYGCPIKESGCCGWPDLGCDESALKWLQQPAAE